MLSEQSLKSMLIENQNNLIVAKYSGGLIEQVSPTRFKAYCIRWHDPNRMDLTGEWFSPKTNRMLKAGYPIVGAPLNYQHGMHKGFGSTGIGLLDFTNEDEIGQFVEGELYTRAEYIEMLKEIGRLKEIKASDSQYIQRADMAVKAVNSLISSVPMQMSGGFDPSTWIVDPETKHIDQSGLIHLALTPTPADDLNPLVEFKSTWKSILELEHERKTFDMKPSIQTDTPIAHKETMMSKDATAIADNEERGGESNAEIEVEISVDTEEETEDATMTPQDLIQMLIDKLMEYAASMDVPQTEAQPIVDATMEAVSPDVPQDPQQLMTEEDMVKVAGKALDLFKAEIAKRDKAAKSVANVFESATRNRKMQADDFVGGGTASTKSTATVGDRFPHWQAEDYAFAFMIDQQIRAKGKRGIIGDEDAAQRLMKEYVAKAEKQHAKGQFDIPHSAQRAFKSIKANELNYSTQASYGDEWVPDSWDSNLWRKARIDTVVLPQFRSVEMPSNPYELPIEGTDSTMYYVSETTGEAQMTLNDANSPIPDSKIGSGKVQLSAKKFGTRVMFSAELEEDSIIPVLNMYREQAQIAFMEGIDDVLLNGDTQTGSTNINSDGSALGATSRYLAFDGLRKDTFTNSTNQTDGNGAAPTLTNLRTIRFNLSRQTSTKLAGLRIFVNPEAYGKLLNMDEFITMDKAGALATAQTGQIGFVDGIPVFATDQLPLTDADGKVTAAGNAVNRGTVVMVYTPHWVVGYRRRIASNLDFLSYYDSYVLTLTARMDFKPRDTDSTVALINVGI